MSEASDPALGQRIRVDERTYILVLTGAGVSAESGIPTFRAGGGLWESYPVEQVASPSGFRSDPALVWRFYSERRKAAKTCSPNPGHNALVELERRLGDRFLLATQNVDGLHRRAGSERLIELHGNLFRTRCTSCDRPPFDDDTFYGINPEVEEDPPACDKCAARGRIALLRPHIVWFGEMLDAEDLESISAFMARAAAHRFIFLAAGTSGVVYPAAGLVTAASRLGAETWLVNADPADNVDSFDHFIQGKSGEVLPTLWDWS